MRKYRLLQGAIQVVCELRIDVRDAPDAVTGAAFRTKSAAHVMGNRDNATF
ncbi:MAG: hypothetical protein JSR18_10350 [Proteobacteria bacterium]|nr:hypothetical protein [Pseudomonadota bacterium]